MAKLTSSTGKTTADVSPDGHSIIQQSVEGGAQTFWPASDWEELKAFVDAKLKRITEKIDN